MYGGDMGDESTNTDPAVASSNVGADPRVPLAHERTQLAYDRSRWAAERTLMAWVRTSLSMISFGFAIDKIFATLQQELNKVHVGRGYHLLGVVLVVVGILVLLLSLC